MTDPATRDSIEQQMHAIKAEAVAAARSILARWDNQPPMQPVPESMDNADLRSCCWQLIQAAETLRNCWIERTGLTVADDPYVEDAMSAVASVRAELNQAGG